MKNAGWTGLGRFGFAGYPDPCSPLVDSVVQNDKMVNYISFEIKERKKKELIYMWFLTEIREIIKCVIILKILLMYI